MSPDHSSEILASLRRLLASDVTSRSFRALRCILDRLVRMSRAKRHHFLHHVLKCSRSRSRPVGPECSLPDASTSSVDETLQRIADAMEEELLNCQGIPSLCLILRRLCSMPEVEIDNYWHISEEVQALSSDIYADAKAHARLRELRSFAQAVAGEKPMFADDLAVLRHCFIERNAQKISGFAFRMLLQSLCLYGEHPALPAVLQYLQAFEPRRRSAQRFGPHTRLTIAALRVYALSVRKNDSSSAAVLSRWLHSPKAKVRREVALSYKCIFDVGNEQAIRVLTEELRHGALVKQAALDSLAYLLPLHEAGVVSSLLANSSKAVRLSAVHAVGRILGRSSGCQSTPVSPASIAVRAGLIPADVAVNIDEFITGKIFKAISLRQARDPNHRVQAAALAVLRQLA